MSESGNTALQQLLEGDRGLHIGGRRTTGAGPGVQLRSPASGEVLGTLSEATADQVDQAVHAARQAFTSGPWAQDADHRAAVLRRLAELVAENTEEIAYLDAVEAGKVFAGSRDEDVPDFVDNLRFFADLISRDEGRFLQNGNGWGWVKKIPIGVVGAVLPWNYPIAMLGWKVAPALAAGNSMVIKPSEESTLSALWFAELAAAAGVPSGVVNVLTGTGRTVGRALGLHPDVDALTFTGSGPVGRSFLESSAKSNLKKVSLELGGRAGYIVDVDYASDFAAIAADVVGAAFGTSGQNCTASSRVIVVGDDEERFQQFRDALVAATAKLALGDPLSEGTDVGPVITAASRDRITTWVDEAVGKGATVINDPAQVPEAGNWYPPTIVEGVPTDSELGRGEIFGPVTSLLRVSSRDEAVRAINDDQYGLASTVWCEDLAMAKWWSDRIRVGTLAINGYSEGTVATPFGGLRQSGFWGRDNGPEALESYQESMTVWVSGS
ncbi:aldehyde dehydrogenase family protein [Brevibacterium sp. ZH18]|uniref:aldehyde dehydrogenase family protein n=1 Tax=Brevibacterium sp. ZH18 TaxID=2927784 RepID=UPI001F616A00|nr:aldehyde dehydrogenase family protein [Brevibacterium sp. ZH18]MCI4011409.1 aldehyde dehydrogenase family protein [Brevibacterium sp. ZH18]